MNQPYHPTTKQHNNTTTGPSGAGKSSLFDVLARRIGTSGRLEVCGFVI
jgi:ABC-type multidrug transport system ATPase subunit